MLGRPVYPKRPLVKLLGCGSSAGKNKIYFIPLNDYTPKILINSGS